MENYEVIKLVGEGSFARVYKAKKKDTGAIVALKVIGKVIFLYPFSYGLPSMDS